MIEKEIINAGLTRFFPVIVLKDDEHPDHEVVMDRDDYSEYRIRKGMNDREIMRIAGVI